MPASAQVRLDVVLRGGSDIEKTLKGSKKAIDDTGKAAADMGDEIAKAGEDGARSLGFLEGTISGLPGKIADIESAFNLVAGTFGTIENAFETMADAEQRLIKISAVANAYPDIANALGKLSEASRGLVGREELAELANRAKLLGIGFEDLTLTMQAASAISIKTGQNFDSVAEAIIETAAGTVVSADRYNELTGSTLNLKAATEQWAKANGVLASSMGELENRKAINPATFADLRSNIGRLEEGTESAATGWTRFSNAFSAGIDKQVEGFARSTGAAFDWLMGWEKSTTTAGVSFQGLIDLTDRFANESLANEARAMRDAIDLRQQFERWTVAARDAQQHLNDATAEFAPIWAQFRAAIKREQEKDAAAGRQAARQRSEWALSEWQKGQEALTRLKLDNAAEARKAEAAAAQAELERIRQIGEARANSELQVAEEQGARELARVQHLQSIRAIEAEQRDGELDAEAARIYREVELRRYRAEELAILEDDRLAREQARRESMEQSIASIQMMDAQLGQVEGTLAKTLRGTGRIMQAITLNFGAIVRGEAGAIASLSAVTAAQMDNRKAANTLMAASSLAEAYFALGRYDFWSAGNYFLAAGLFGAAAASGSGGGGRGGGPTGATGAPAGAVQFGQATGAQSSGNAANVGGQTIVVNGFVGNPDQLAVVMAGAQDRSRRANLVRAEGV